ncbi:LOW QUALITY PROTEIN: serine racemase [Macrochelys suwanniensis]
MSSPYCISLADVEGAQSSLHGLIHLTLILTSSSLDKLASHRLFKCELFQKTVSFKVKLTNTLYESNGRLALRPCQLWTQFKSSPRAIGTRNYHSSIHRKQGWWPLSIRVYAAEPCNADDSYRSKVTGTPPFTPPDTIADSVKTRNTWPIIKDLVDDVLTVTEEEIQQATQLVWERIKLLIEPTAGVGVAAVLSEQFRSVSQEVKNLCIVLCEGNIALRSLAWLSPPGKEANGN